MDFTGENLLPGKLGHFFILFSFVASLAATICYIVSARDKNPLVQNQWLRAARIFFITETISIISIFVLLFYIISNHMFEFKYAWQHSSRTLEPKYLLSCFWEGQEGSFLLWSFWHCILGLIVMKKERTREAPVMAVVSFMQVCLATMLIGHQFPEFNFLGTHFEAFKLGSNPFVLLRNELDAPIFSNPGYLSMIKDGNDLNPLLQNYWMVIHPPVLFLGFASTLIPFAYAIAGLWRKDYTGWTKPALSWSLFSAAVLGTGIMMGAKWAYESLNFGGYWAWDPVENASLVPWLIMVGGIHAMLIYRATGNALRSATLFYILSFLFILYSTYLTRSGDLQETSVHAFTDLGMKAQLRAFLFVFFAPALVLFFMRYKRVPHILKEEETSAREFWMFIGSLILLLSAATIIVMTSLPVINKIIGIFASDKEVFKPFAMGEDSAHAYNRIQIFVAIILGLLTAVTQYLRYKSTPKKLITKKLLWPTLIAVLITALVLAFGNINYTNYGAAYLGAIWLAFFCSIYTVTANAFYIKTGLNGKFKAAGGSVAHIGFGVLLAGILISSSKKEVLSYNTSGIPVFFGNESKEKTGENLTLVKGVKTDMGKYWVTYSKDSMHPKKEQWYYKLDFESKDQKSKFTLWPDAFVNYKGNEGLMANPDAKHFAGHDIFTYITSLPDPSKTKDTSKFRKQTVKTGDTIYYSRGFAVLEDINTKDHIPQPGFAPTDSATVATLKVFAKTSSIYTLQTLLINKGGQNFPMPDTVAAENLVIQIEKLVPGGGEFGIKESDSLLQYVTLKAYKFPMINLVWAGTVIMVIGIIMSLVRRIKMGKREPANFRIS
jgi:cytochrome c-type biogenesis protein CcmF